MDKEKEIEKTLKQIGNIKDLDSDLEILKEKLKELGIKRFKIKQLRVNKRAKPINTGGSGTTIPSPQIGYYETEIEVFGEDDE